MIDWIIDTLPFEPHKSIQSIVSQIDDVSLFFWQLFGLISESDVLYVDIFNGDDARAK